MSCYTARSLSPKVARRIPSCSLGLPLAAYEFQGHCQFQGCPPPPSHLQNGTLYTHVAAVAVAAWDGAGRCAECQTRRCTHRSCRWGLHSFGSVGSVGPPHTPPGDGCARGCARAALDCTAHCNLLRLLLDPLQSPHNHRHRSAMQHATHGTCTCQCFNVPHTRTHIHIHAHTRARACMPQVLRL